MNAIVGSSVHEGAVALESTIRKISWGKSTKIRLPQLISSTSPICLEATTCGFEVKNLYSLCDVLGSYLCSLQINLKLFNVIL